jgi:YidC/Oxa1 family membrane protein insertase
VFEFLGVPAHALIMALTAVLHTPAAIGVVLTTILFRLAILPLGMAQHKADLGRMALMEKAKRLNERFRNSPERLEQELTGLYRTEAGGLARGCLPALAQIPFFAALYQAFSSPTISGKANILLQESLWGVPLSAKLFAVTGPQLAVFAAILILLAAIAFASSRVARKRTEGWARLLYYAPMLSVAFLPLAASLYLVTSMAWSLGQAAVLRQWLG